jgi:hypothetical protein
MSKSETQEYSAQSKWKLTKEIIEDICHQNNKNFTSNEVQEEFERRYPDKKSCDVSDNIRMMTVNSQSRLSYLQFYGRVSQGKNLRYSSIKNSEGRVDNKREYPRISSKENEKDFLFHNSLTNQYEIYEPTKHGVWEVILDADDVNHLRKIDDEGNKDKLVEEAEALILDEDDESSFPEGRELFKTHRHLERDGKIPNKAKAKRLAETGKLECEVCNMDFHRFYGMLGEGFIEAHHAIPVSKLNGAMSTKVSDLALVCSNCHRMLHRGQKLLSLDELRVMINGAIPETQ